MIIDIDTAQLMLIGVLDAQKLMHHNQFHPNLPSSTRKPEIAFFEENSRPEDRAVYQNLTMQKGFRLGAGEQPAMLTLKAQSVHQFFAPAASSRIISNVLVQNFLDLG